MADDDKTQKTGTTPDKPNLVKQVNVAGESEGNPQSLLGPTKIEKQGPVTL